MSSEDDCQDDCGQHETCVVQRIKEQANALRTAEIGFPKSTPPSSNFFSEACLLCNCSGHTMANCPSSRVNYGRN